MKTIEITTSQKVTIQYELATVGNRLLAYFLDAVIVFGTILFLVIIGVQALRESEELMMYFGFLILLPIYGFYHLASEILFDGQSIGKRALGIKVVKLNGDAPSAHDYFIRWVFRFVDTFFSIGSVAALLVSASPRSQRVGDVLAGTTVIRQTPSRMFSLRDILRIASLENYEVSYPHVTQLSERDMLFVKKVLERERRYFNKAHQQAAIELATHLANRLEINNPPRDFRVFLRTLLTDYIVLTR